MLAVSVDPPEKAREMLRGMKDQDRPRFPVVCDPRREAVKRLGVHDHRHDLALPAVLILDRQGRLAWKHVAENVLDRPGEDRLIEALRSIPRE